MVAGNCIYTLINHQLLFDLQDDPHEIIDRSEGKEELLRMRELMTKVSKDHDDPYPLSVEVPHEPKATFKNEDRIIDRWQPQWILDKYFNGQKPKK